MAFEITVLDNDTRGWIMTCVSGVACVLGASIICVDFLVRLFPGMKHFRIQDSQTFLAASLSLSFGVMLFSALYSILPASQASLIKGGFSPGQAAWTLIACFLAGAASIQVVSRLMHDCIPSHAVDCDHSHDEVASRGHAGRETQERHPASSSYPSTEAAPSPSESTPLLSSANSDADSLDPLPVYSNASGTASETTVQASSARPSLHRKVSALVSGAKASCDLQGPCFGYSDPSGLDCRKQLPMVLDPKAASWNPLRRPLARRNASPLVRGGGLSTPGGVPRVDGSRSPDLSGGCRTPDAAPSKRLAPSGREQNLEAGTADPSHHHHVPTNAFLAIGLQTSIAIALHRLPEGFITFATNHANPKLGLAVFMALFVHNVVEGFSMALPLFLALGSRGKAMFWSSLFGGVSQPLGAAVAAAWLQAAGRGDMAPGGGAYGIMFAVTSGIMTSVALQLFSEGLSLQHSRPLCFVFAFLGMGILGASSALTAV
ncbi:MAG: hypothetical protein M1832_000302 [Thelocarpon impressellum]|nr:MAG: hypothetical protein M1832_000302 [Thelocarpon impressellum]